MKIISKFSIFNFLKKIFPKSIFSIHSRTNKYCYWIQHIRISLKSFTKYLRLFLCFSIVSVYHSEVDPDYCYLRHLRILIILRILENVEILGKFQNWVQKCPVSSLVSSLPSENENLAIAQRKWTKSAIKRSMKVLLYLIWETSFNILCEEWKASITISNRELWFSGPNLSKKGIFSQKQVKLKTQSNSAYLN